MTARACQPAGPQTVLAGSSDLTPEDAFTVLRSHARAHGLRMTALARDVVDRTIDVTTIIQPAL